MPYTAGDVMDAAAALLNDAAKTFYTYTVQLPYLKLANDDLESQLLANGIVIQNAVATINVAAGSLTLPLPADFFIPINLMERAQTSTNDNDFIDMEERDFEPSTAKVDTLNFWAFRNGAINFVGSTKDRTVRIFYKRTLAAITNVLGTDVEEVTKAKNFLVFRTAALVAEFGGGGNEARASSLNTQGAVYLDTLLTIFVKANQGNRVRRKPFRMNRSVINVRVG